MRVCINFIEYDLNLSKKSATIVGRTGTDSDLMIPDCIHVNNDTFQITQIGNAAFRNDKYLQLLHLPSTIVNIQPRAFEWSGIVEIERYGTIPEAAITIHEAAFKDCQNLKMAIFNGSIFLKGICIFKGCVNLAYFQSEKIQEKIPVYAFAGVQKLENFWISDGVRIYDTAFEEANIKTVYLENNVQNPEALFNQLKDCEFVCSKSSNMAECAYVGANISCLGDK